MKIKTKLQITTALAVVFSALLGGCKAMNSLFIHPISVLLKQHDDNDPKYIIHDTNTDQYWRGNHIWSDNRDYAWEYSKSDAKELVAKMHSGKIYGSHVGARIERNKPRYIIHDTGTMESDYWTGTNWWTREHAQEMSKAEARRTIVKMRKEEAGGYADVGPEDERPIVMERK